MFYCYYILFYTKNLYFQYRFQLFSVLFFLKEKYQKKQKTCRFIADFFRRSLLSAIFRRYDCEMLVFVRIITRTPTSFLYKASRVLRLRWESLFLSHRKTKLDIAILSCKRPSSCNIHRDLCRSVSWDAHKLSPFSARMHRKAPSV